MEFDFENGVLTFDKELTSLDKEVFAFVSILDKLEIKYVLMSGYVAIVFGRTRGTEDVDLFMEKLDSEKFGRLFGLWKKRGYWILNTDEEKDALDMLESGLAIRVAKKDTVVPNFEARYPKKDMDFESMRKPLEVVMNKRRLLMSPLEIQIAVKFWLGTEKDVEDAVHIYETFKRIINKEYMRKMAKGLGVSGAMHEKGVE